MRIKSILLLLVCFLLTGLTMPAVACPPGDCDDCETWNAETETCDWDCPTGQCCQNDDCVATCSGCYKCVDNYCEQCKCWDDGNPITGSITVQDAKLCEEVTHTSSISDTDHWFKGGNGGEGCEGSPSDTIYSYPWSKTVDTNPESGTFMPPTDEATIQWRAPPCTGTVIIKLTADDKPDSMDNPCPDSDRNDDSEDFEDTSNVSLPSDCSDCGTPGDVTPNITEDDSCVSCGSDYGYAAPIGPHTYTLKTPCYEICKWYAYLDTVDSTFNICRSCPSNPATVACLDDVAEMNQTEACDHLQNFPNNPVELSDIDEDNWCRDCVAVHEETHMNKDWKEDSLQPEIDEFADWCWGHEIDIDCGDSDSTDCTTALTTSVKAEYDAEWYLRSVAALNTYFDLMVAGEISAYAAYLACYQDIYNALDAKCNP